MANTQALQAILTRYDEAAAQAAAQAGAFAGAFGMGDDPKKDACHQIFYQETENWVQRFLADAPDEAEVSRAVTMLLEAAFLRRNKPTYWYCCAAQKHAETLIPLLGAADAAAIYHSFSRMYPKLDRTPVQNTIAALLAKAAGTPEKHEEKNTMLTLWTKRVIALLVGLTIAHLGVTLFLLADLGSDPFNVAIQGIFRTLPQSLGITHGTVHVAVSLLIILVLLVVDRSYVRIGTFLCMVLGGPIIDMFTLLLGGVVNSGSSFALRVIAVILGCGILAFGMTIVIKSEAGTGPNDLVAVVISDKRKWKFGAVRIAVDLGFTLIGFLLGGTVGVGTLICMAVVGPIAQVFMPFSQRLCSRFIAESTVRE